MDETSASRDPANRGDARPYVDRDATDSTIRHLALAGVNPSSDAQPQFPDALDDVASTRKGAGGTVERREEAVPCGIDLLAVRLAKCFSNDGVVPVEKLTPTSVT